ncbi:MAG: DUF2325 domain-containing protein [Campylobacteraceae bacterium]|nr:DUF2325 domain-containing protein [Campylobacteraceae bacterium]
MSVLVVGADEITPIKAVLKDLGVSKVEHWDARNENRVNRKSIPYDTNCVVMLTSFLNHNTMKKIKNDAKKRNIPIVCAKRSVSCVFCEYCKVFGIDKDFCPKRIKENE